MMMEILVMMMWLIIGWLIIGYLIALEVIVWYKWNQLMKRAEEVLKESKETCERAEKELEHGRVNGMEWSDYKLMSVGELRDELKSIEEMIDYILNSGDRYDDVIEMYDFGNDIETYSQLADDIESLIAEKEMM